jgi:hypothetical protein
MEGKWVYFDDMWSTVQLFSSLQELKQHYPVGWFFTIFQLKHTSTSRPTETNLDSSLKRKISHDEISSYQKIQSNVANNLTATEKEITEHNFRTKEVDLKCSKRKLFDEPSHNLSNKRTKNDMKMHCVQSSTENMKAMQLGIYQCTVCHEAWPLKTKPKLCEYVCARCSRDKNTPKKFSNENSMIPSPVPKQLQGLTQF